MHEFIKSTPVETWCLSRDDRKIVREGWALLLLKEGEDFKESLFLKDVFIYLIIFCVHICVYMHAIIYVDTWGGQKRDY